MLPKFSLFLFVALVALSQAIARQRHDKKPNSSKEDLQEGYHHYHEVGSPRGRPLNLNLNSNYYKVRNLTSQLYTEFFILATGDNYLSPEVSNDVHVDARAVVLLTQKLRDFKHAYEILANVTSDYALKGVRVEDKQVMSDLVNEVVSRLHSCPDFIAIKSSLSDSFISRQKYFKKDATAEEKETVVKDTWLREPFMRQAILNRIFYIMQAKERNFHEFFDAIISHASDDQYGPKLEQIYSNALSKTVKEICPAHEEKKAKERFFKLIVQQLSEDPALAVKLYGSNKLHFVNTKF